MMGEEDRVTSVLVRPAHLIIGFALAENDVLARDKVASWRDQGGWVRIVHAVEITRSASPVCVGSGEEQGKALDGRSGGTFSPLLFKWVGDRYSLDARTRRPPAWRPLRLDGGRWNSTLVSGIVDNCEASV